MDQKILFITPALSKAGAETQLIKVAGFLKTKLNDVLILSLLPKDDYSINTDQLGIRVVFLQSWRTHFFSNVVQLNRIVKEFKPKTVIAFMFIAIIFARILKLKFGFNLISSIRAAEIPNKWYLPFKLTSNLDDVVIYNSMPAKKHFESKNLVKRGGNIINNAISIPGIVQLNKAEDTSEKPFTWICVAHFRIEKDYLTLFKAIALIKNRNFRLNIVGHLFNQEWPMEVLTQLQIQDKVSLLGFKSNATDFLREADAFVVSSFTESMPNAILEAMANQMPIVATAVGGVSDLVAGADCGFCFKQGDEKELAAKMCRVMEMSSTERYRLGLNGRKYVESNFSEARVMDSWLSVINRYPSQSKPVLAEL